MLWEFEGWGYWSLGDGTGGMSRDLRVHVEERKDFSGSSMDKAALLDGLEHGTPQRASGKRTGIVSLGHEVDKYVNKVWG